MLKPRANCFCLHFEGFTLRNSLVMQQSCFSSKIWGRMILERTSVKEFMQTMSSWWLQYKSQLSVSIWLYAVHKMAFQTNQLPLHPTWSSFHKLFCAQCLSFAPYAKLLCHKKLLKSWAKGAKDWCWAWNSLWNRPPGEFFYVQFSFPYFCHSIFCIIIHASKKLPLVFCPKTRKILWFWLL